MKKSLVLLILAALPLVRLLAQDVDPVFVKGDKIVNLGIGFGSTYYASYYGTHMPALSGSFEIGVKDGVIEKGSIGVGGYLGYSSAKYDNYWKTSNFIIGVRGSFHYPLVKKLDTYTGLLLGYNVYSYKYYDTYLGGYSTSPSTVAFAWYAGARYYFSDKIAAMAEIGYGISYLTLGVAFKL
jgi:hypothetical protein